MRFVALLVVAAAFVGGVAQAKPGSSVQLEKPIPGIDFPTDTGMPNIMILVVGQNRIATDANAEILKAPGGKLLVIEGAQAKIKIEKAQAGIDFPTDGPRNLKRDFLVWVVSENVRIPVSQILSIVRAERGVDIPTDAPVRSNFLVLILEEGKRIQLK